MALPKTLAASLLTLSALLTQPAQAEVLDRIVAVVNDGVVLQSELDTAMESTKSQIKSRGVQLPSDDVLRPQVLERVIVTRLQTQRATQAGIRIDDRELNDILNNIARQNNMTLAQLADSVKADGIDFLTLREQVREEVLVARLRQREVDGRVVVTDQDVDLYLANQGANTNTEYHLGHILVSIPDGANSDERDKRRAKANDLLKRLRAGEDFAQLAISSSDGQQALQGGDLDWRKAADLPSLFATAAGRLKDGEVSDVIETGTGFHIIKRLGTRGGEERLTTVETHSQHILLMANALRTEDQARVQIQELSERLKKGEDFAKLAKQFSDDPGSKNSGGDLDWQPPGVFAPDFQKALDSLQPGEVSAPFHTQFGWHIAKVLDRRTRDTTEEAKRAKVRQAIAQRKSTEEYETWIRRLRDEAYIDYRLAGTGEADKS